MGSVVVSGLIWVAVAVGLVSLFARRFTWRSPWVYAAAAAGVTQVVTVLVFGHSFLSTVLVIAAWVGVLVWYYRQGRLF